MANQIKQGDIGNFIDPWKNLHKGCIVVFAKENTFNVAELYSPNFHETFAFATDGINFTKTNGDQDAKTRKMNFEYACQHSGNNEWKWSEEDETVHS